MHHIYHTEGIILESRDVGEASKLFYIFTRDLGMVTAEARGVRKMSSKLRFVLQDFRYLKIDFIQRQNIFRVTSASKTGVLEHITKQPKAFKIFSNIARLLRRLLAGTEPNEKLFSDLFNGLLVLEKASTPEELRNIEIILVLRILNNLGYIGEEEALSNLTKSPFEDELVFKVSKDRARILKEINRALKETHL